MEELCKKNENIYPGRETSGYKAHTRSPDRACRSGDFNPRIVFSVRIQAGCQPLTTALPPFVVALSLPRAVMTRRAGFPVHLLSFTCLGQRSTLISPGLRPLNIRPGLPLLPRLHLDAILLALDLAMTFHIRCRLSALVPTVPVLISLDLALTFYICCRLSARVLTDMILMLKNLALAIFLPFAIDRPGGVPVTVFIPITMNRRPHNMAIVHRGTIKPAMMGEYPWAHINPRTHMHRITVAETRAVQVIGTVMYIPAAIDIAEAEEDIVRIIET